MTSGSSIGFSIRLCAFFMEQDRLFDNYFRAEGDISYGEFTLMYALWEVAKPVPLEPLSQFLMLKTRTVRQSALDLEGRGLVRKQNDPQDGRYMLLELTEMGRKVTEKSVADLMLLLKNSFFDGLSEDELAANLRSGMRGNLNYIRGCEVAEFGDIPADFPYSMAVDHFVFWRAVLSNWRSLVREGHDLSLNEFCVLCYLSDCGAAFPSDVATELFFSPSSISLCKQHLSDKGLVLERAVTEDGRRSLLSVTDAGRRVAEAAFAEIDAYTREIHSAEDSATMDIVNAWYARMFLNMWRPVRRH